jgi:dTDP-4-dehydrorhamnose 3,5-epimerase
VKFEETPLAGAWVVRLDAHEDERGTFVATFREEDFASHGLNPHVSQTSLSWNRVRGTLRGLHLQDPPFAEAKLVSCLRGSLFDVIVDLRDGSPTRNAWFGLELRAGDLSSLYIPEGCAHGFQTLEDDTLVGYVLSAPYRADAARVCAYDDPAFGISWPLPPGPMSARDAAAPRQPVQR